MPDRLIDRITGLLKKRQWYEQPRLLAMFRLGEIRADLREKNLHDTEDPLLKRADAGTQLDPAVRDSRSTDGTNNDLLYPAMGSVGRRFGRNVPLEHVVPDKANLMTPSPRVVSRELMTREQFQPATILNLLAASWIQFQVHDWFVHKRSKTQHVEIPLAPGDNWGEPTMRVPATEPDPGPQGSKRPPAYANVNSHWWDCSQLYGCDAATARQVRTMTGGKLKIEPTGLLPVDPVSGISISGFTDNWWIGLAMLHTLFTWEHNYICDLLAHHNPTWTDQQLFAKARLITTALVAKIHTVEWTCAILPHPIIKTGMNTNWYGLLEGDLQDAIGFIDDSEILGGIIGSKADHHAAPYSLTEEFVAVYRMHPLLPDDFTFRSIATDEVVQERTFRELGVNDVRARLDEFGFEDSFYSFGIAHPGAITLHNYPRFLQELQKPDGTVVDLAAIDVLRIRERGVPRYNEFRRLFHLKPAATFDELTDNPQWARELREVYGDVEQVDLMVGLYAEPLPKGFGFSDTAFRVFILMASRRLKSDRFFTRDYNAETYTQTGLDWIEETSMRDVLLRHYPELAPTLRGVDNAFAPWTRVSA
jgi:hypothetical protein